MRKARVEKLGSGGCRWETACELAPSGEVWNKHRYIPPLQPPRREAGEAKGGKGIPAPATFPVSTGFGSRGGGGLSILSPVNCLIGEQ